MTNALKAQILDRLNEGDPARAFITRYLWARLVNQFEKSEEPTPEVRNEWIALGNALNEAGGFHAMESAIDPCVLDWHQSGEFDEAALDEAMVFVASTWSDIDD